MNQTPDCQIHSQTVNRRKGCLSYPDFTDRLRAPFSLCNIWVVNFLENHTSTTILQTTLGITYFINTWSRKSTEEACIKFGSSTSLLSNQHRETDGDCHDVLRTFPKGRSKIMSLQRTWTAQTRTVFSDIWQQQALESTRRVPAISY